MFDNIKESALIKKLLSMTVLDNYSGSIAKTILININQIKNLNSIDIANLSFTTQPTVSKFVNNLGYSKFISLKKDLINYCESLKKANYKKSISNQEVVIKNLEFFKNIINYDFTLIVDLIRKSKNILINASGGGLRACNELVTQLSRMGYHAVAPYSFSDRYRQAVIKPASTLVICVSVSGLTSETIIPTQLLLNKKATVIYISANEIKELEKASIKINFSKYTKQKINSLSFNLYLNIFWMLLLNVL